MNSFLRLFQKENNKKLLLILVIIAFILRLWITFSTRNRIFDGEFLSFLAYDWSLNPVFITSGNWPPGYRYLTGAFNWVVSNPLYATRIFNVIIGTLTIPVFYYVIVQLYNHTIAITSSIVLVFLPMHIGMSASSLTSTSVLFEMLAAILFVIKASNSNKQSNLYLSLSCLFIVLAESTRYEPWIMSFLFPLFYFIKTRKLRASIIFTIVIFIFPVVWLLGNYWELGAFFPIYEQATETGQDVNLLQGITIIFRIVVSQLGIVITIGLIGGLCLKLIQVARKQIKIDETIYLAILTIYWLFMIRLAMTRGSSLRDRFFLFGLVLTLPYAFLFLENLFKNHRKWFIGFTFISLISLFVTKLITKPIFYAVQSSDSREPSVSELQETVSWLQNSEYSQDHYIYTTMNLGYFDILMFDPDQYSRSSLFLLHTKQTKTDKILEQKNPSLFITCHCEQDKWSKVRFEKQIGKKMSKKNLVYTNNSIRIYRINNLTKD